MIKFVKSLNSDQVFVISFIVSGFLIGLLVVAQFQSSVSANTYLADEINAQADLISYLDQKQNLLKTKIANLRLQIDEQSKQLDLGNETGLIGKLDAMKDVLGLSRIAGSGVEITLNEAGEDEASLIYAADLRDLVNVLRTANVEAIMINNQRIVSSSSINSIGNTILVNRTRIAKPYTIKTVGDVQMILKRLSDQNAYPDLYKRIQDGKIEFNAERKDSLVISVFDGNFILDHAKSK